MERLEIDVTFRTRRLVELTPVEETAALMQKAAWDIANTPEKRAERAIDALDRLQFEHLFDLENRVRALEGRFAVTRAQYRNALINRWIELHAA